MIRWRRAVFPPNPRNIREFAAQLVAPQNAVLRQFDGGAVQSQLIVDGDGEVHLAFWDECILQNHIGDVSRVFADCTFHATPNLDGAYQLLIVNAIKYDHVSSLI